MVLETNIKNSITKEFAWHYKVIPLKKEEDNMLFHIAKDDTNEKTKEELAIILGCTISFDFIDKHEIHKLLNINYRLANKQQKIDKEHDLLVNIISEAIAIGSSDVHFEIFEDSARVRLRIDGVLIEKNNLKKETYQELVNRIKIHANLDISEKRLPQDGRTKIANYDIRVSILPTHFGEKIVMRILGQDTSNINLDDLGFEQQEKTQYLEAIKRSNGIILISGPTGSGKTTTLYATLKKLNEIKRNILTIEDPIEYTLKGINQVQLNEAIGLNFSSALRSFLRQDPDIIMLGEIRDNETAEMAIRASLTGHLVLSTLHTNSAWGTISRLIDMGVPSFLIAETLNISIAQRLVRKLCTHCKKESDINLNDFPHNYKLPQKMEKHYIAIGCDQCHFTGYKGRRAIYEMIPINNEIVTIIKNKEQNIDNYFKENKIEVLADKAFNLLKKGETSLNEIYSLLITSS